ncbi:hypothetical protein AB0F93_00430 [Micromonospora tulbaghiae]|uniref:hypothetical protein n=1 Tax=Micromonospora tulbaghiae TaxID=479978 RepID=UPI00331E224A
MPFGRSDFHWPSAALVPADPGGGVVWLLEHTIRESSTTYVYLDPAVAVRDLACEIRPRWSDMVKALKRIGKLPDGMPGAAPEHDFEALAWYFHTPLPKGHGQHEMYELWPRQVFQDVISRARQPQRALSQAYQEMLCVCGNTASEAGFSYVNEHGQDDNEATPQRLRCNDCLRVLDALTGRVEMQLSNCVNCNQALVWVPRGDLRLPDTNPYFASRLVWAHVSGEGGLPPVVACHTGGTVAAPPATPERTCGQCGGNTGDFAHQTAAETLRSVWAPEFAAAHPAPITADAAGPATTEQENRTVPTQLDIILGDAHTKALAENANRNARWEPFGDSNDAPSVEVCGLNTATFADDEGRLVVDVDTQNLRPLANWPDDPKIKVMVDCREVWTSDQPNQEAAWTVRALVEATLRRTRDNLGTKATVAHYLSDLTYDLARTLPTHNPLRAAVEREHGNDLYTVTGLVQPNSGKFHVTGTFLGELNDLGMTAQDNAYAVVYVWASSPKEAEDLAEEEAQRRFEAAAN